MTRLDLLASCALPSAFLAGAAAAQDLQDRAVAPPAPEAAAPTSTPTDEEQVNFSAGALE